MNNRLLILRLLIAQKQRQLTKLAFNSGKCRCGRTKQNGTPLCLVCWEQLPHSIQNALENNNIISYQAAREYLDVVNKKQ